MEENKNKRVKFKKILSYLSIICGLGRISFYLYMNFFIPPIPRESLLFRYDWQLDFYIKFLTLFSGIGIISGIISFVAKVNKKIAVVGIILSVFSLLIWLFIWLLAIGFELER
jgi:hypothetical protein